MIQPNPSNPATPFFVEPLPSGLAPELGAEVLSGGVRFGVYSRHAREIRVALFREGQKDPVAVLPLPSCEGHVFGGFVPGVKPGMLYGLYADGPFDPRLGHRFNPQKLLIDPYARALWGEFDNAQGILCGHAPGGLDADLTPDRRPSHAHMPKGVILQDDFDWEGDAAPAIPPSSLVIYETHVRGFTAHATSGVSEPGTFAGLMEKIPYLQSLGVNAVELLPVHAKYSEDFLVEKGLTNYWGYNTAAFFALEPGYGSRRAPGCEVNEFKRLVRALHRAGMEIILDVVYNHTAEANELGPTLSLRGLDNKSYYALVGPEDAPYRHGWNHTGCGNTLDFGSQAVLRLVLDSLRCFVREFHVDGFRFDLATVHGRSHGGQFHAHAPFFAAVAQDPVLRKVKMIAEPWDLSSYGVGRFPAGWMEWNGGFRDIARRWVRGDPGLFPLLVDKLEASSEVYEPSGREPWASVNFITAHDGFTLRDWVTYHHKHNQANGEKNNDGSNDNHGWNCGHEGPSDQPEIESLRQRQARNLMLLNMLARGTPMLLGGDELGRTQGGNNNAYCQDNAVSWMDWSRVDSQAGFLRFCRELLAWRKILNLSGRWMSPATRAWGHCWHPRDLAGRPLGDKNPEQGYAAFLLSPAPVAEVSSTRLNPELHGALYYLLLNPEDSSKVFHLPYLPPQWHWAMIINTALEPPEDIVSARGVSLYHGEPHYEVSKRSSVLLRTLRREPEGKDFANRFI